MHPFFKAIIDAYLVAAGAVPQVAEALDKAASWLRERLDAAA
jgi:hypothetical protein